MFCSKCGAQIPDHSQVCPYCRQPVSAGQGGSAGQPVVRQRSRINNIFSALVRDKTPGAVAEFVLWCTVCLIALLFMVAAIMVDDSNFYGAVSLDGYRVYYLVMMILVLGLGTAMAFRLKTYVLLCGVTVFQFIMCIFYYAVNAGMIGKVLEIVENEYDDYLTASYPVFLVIFFVLTLLAGIGAVTCLFIHMFSRINLGKIIAILSIVQAGMQLLMSILMYTLPSFDMLTFSSGASRRQSNAEEWLAEVFSKAAFWLGSITFLFLCGVLAVYAALFFMGCIDSAKDKIYVSGANGGGGNYSGQNGGTPAFQPALQCIQGSYPGQVLYLQGQEISIGAQPGVSVYLQDSYVSKRHCQIRFNMSTGYYEVMDMSTNGVYNQSTGARLQKGLYTSCPRGTVLCIGSMGQQFRLL